MDDINYKTASAYAARYQKFLESLHSSIRKQLSNPFTKPAGFMDGYPFEATNITDIVINGCGGTGGWFIPKLAKIMLDASMKKRLAPNINLYLIDGDTVADKNIIRQNFIQRDVGKNKAEVLANRYAPIFPPGVTVNFVDKFLTNEVIYNSYDQVIRGKFAQIHELPAFANRTSNADFSSILVINFVDNAISRRLIHNCAMHNTNRFCLVVDAGNNLYNGQVNLSLYQNGRLQLPSNYYLRNFDEIKDNENVKLDNCADADLAINNPEQLFNANDMSATITGNIINDMFATSMLTYGLVKFVTGKTMAIQNLFPLSFVNLYAPVPERIPVPTHYMVIDAFNTPIYKYFSNQYVYKNTAEIVDSILYNHSINGTPINQSTVMTFGRMFCDEVMKENPALARSEERVYIDRHRALIANYDDYLTEVANAKAAAKAKSTLPKAA